VSARTYMGRPCRKGHDGERKTERYVSSGYCVKCSLERGRRYREGRAKKPPCERPLAERFTAIRPCLQCRDPFIARDPAAQYCGIACFLRHRPIPQRKFA